ncbi:GNAT family N-acetyltransferase [Pediococcus ethanolidurans]|uniref:Acetyltransferase n=1 Tax=Pediococcus ethanolidurans TaxID=319653 RepID=A0A0R2K3T5_9LACO|nr:GNAT family N-acetyltransferase [Pediococcus ethanolidurans]KRN81957.1 acetyltransferase [Pediococcus ethanolidurans]GEN95511.1 N-acetyltransferase [Pediococcus ethanolidurans]SER79408.1 putative acetyltransferase [Pediococcus ethanolidurans]
MLKIRKIEPTDDQAVKKIIQDCLRDAHLNIPGTAYFDPQLDSLAEYYNDLPKSIYWVVFDDLKKEVVGGCGVGPVPGHPNICELQKLYLKPEARGHGLSKVLLKKALEFAQVYYQKMYVVTDTKLEVANILYQHAGFTKLDHPLTGDEHLACDTQYLKDI